MDPSCIAHVKCEYSYLSVGIMSAIRSVLRSVTRPRSPLRSARGIHKEETAFGPRLVESVRVLVEPISSKSRLGTHGRERMLLAENVGVLAELVCSGSKTGCIGQGW